MNILIADDHHVVRQALRVLLCSHGYVVVEAATGQEAIRLATEAAPDVVLMDVELPDIDGLEATRRIVGQNPLCRVVVLSAHTEQPIVARAVVSGASGYVPKVASFEELVRAIRSVVAGERYIGITFTDDDGRTTKSPLSLRETEVLKLIAEGYATKEVAAKLDLSGKTVETHRRKIMEKLDIDNVAGLTKYAIRAGLTDIAPQSNGQQQGSVAGLRYRV